MTLEEYLSYDDGTDRRYELVDGVLVDVGAERPLNIDIAMFLIVMFAQLIPIRLIHRGTELVVPGAGASTRYPDLVVLSEACAAALAGKPRSLITLEMPAPALVVEVVSPGNPGEQNYDRDYIEKRREYALRGIPEYWIIDPDRQVVLVLTLTGQTYQDQRFMGNEAIVSPTFPQFQATAEQILKAGQTS
ncbi:MAG: Uma2 family endonuclease [Cyanobacteriota bacterium SKYGB_h_bin112]|nr:Uma2 family endonuclease [Cyanobacteriota bacterium SKYGB_h_bin112]